MKHHVQCPIPMPGGGDCWEEPHPASRHGLCVTHWREAIQDWVEDAPLVARVCGRCGAENRFEPIYWAAARCGKCSAHMNDPNVILERDRLFEAEVSARSRPVVGVVYYVRLDRLVKIGFSRNFPERMKSVPHDTVLAIEPGDYSTERARHQQFEKYRAQGHREWFHASPELLAHAEALRAEHGAPRQFSSGSVSKSPA